MISGKVVGPGRSDIGEISGHWSSAIEFKDKDTKEKKVLFDPSTSRVAPKKVLPESEQEEYESRRCVFLPFFFCKRRPAADFRPCLGCGLSSLMLSELPTCTVQPPPSPL